MDDFTKGCFFMVCVAMLFLIGIGLGFVGSNISIANQCKSYDMATIDNKVYNCTPRGDK